MMDSSELFAAIRAGDQDKVRRLISQNPKLVNAVTGEGQSALVISVYYHQPEIARLLVEGGAELNFFEAAMVGDAGKVAEWLAKNPALLDAFSPDGFTGLGFAAFFGHTEVARLLLDRSAQVNLASRNPMRVTPLHSSVAGRHFEISLMLLEHGADVNAQQQEDFTPLQEAAQNGQIDMVKLILSYHPAVDARQAGGKTALRIAIEHGHPEVADLLRKHGAVD
jgi:ankyrin repeat protein